MIIVDRALAEREAAGDPIRIGMVGAGAMGRMIALQIATVVPGMRIVAVANRTPDNAVAALRDAGHDDIVHAGSPAHVASAAARGAVAVTDDARLLSDVGQIDVILECTGAVEFAAGVVLDAIAAGKHVVTMNAELQGTVGPLLAERAKAAGVVLTDSDGDQPGVIMNLYRFVRGIGVRPVLAGNMKGLQDEYRTPTTQEGFARRNGLSANMATSFADGTKMSFEMAIVANATGLRVRHGGMLGPECRSVYDAAGFWPVDELLDGPGVVDYVVGATPAPGVFVLGYQEVPAQRHWLRMYKLGDGPIYTFYTPYHLCHLEVPFTIARAALFGDAVVAPDAGHVVDVVARAKRDLKAGETLDGIGYYLTYGVCENADVTRRECMLPMGLSEGCVVTRDIPRDAHITYDDVEVPPGRLIDKLRAEQVSADGKT
ncbi:MAG: NAD(P)-dependent oxidoreductase [Aldersonia sp.]|nr:NAD(P)-dependent oxidoreductase [Aldersonia sp.]